MSQEDYEVEVVEIIRRLGHVRVKAVSLSEARKIAVEQVEQNQSAVVIDWSVPPEVLKRTYPRAHTVAWLRYAYGR